MLFLLSLVVRVLARLLVLSGADEATKDLEILVLQHQLRVLRRQAGRPRFTALDRVLLAGASRALPRQRWMSLFLVTPQTVLRWHRDLVRRKWTDRNRRQPGRPPLDAEVVALVLRMARETPRWGCVRMQRRTAQAWDPGGRHDHQDAAATPRTGPGAAALRADLDAVPQAQAEGIVACDFFTVETIWLQSLYVLFFIQVSTRQVVAVGVTAQPDSSWVTQQARNATMELNDRRLSTRFLLCDHDAKFTRPFDDVFRSEGGQVIRTPIRAPRANAHAERWVQTVRVECLDWTLVLGRRHLLRLLGVYVRHYNQQRPTAASRCAFPCPPSSVRRTAALIWSRVVMCSAASSTNITRSQHAEPGYPPPTGLTPTSFLRHSYVIVYAHRVRTPGLDG
jgi:putative transposase